MKNVDDLIDNATTLADQGRSTGEIADELNVSRETASWLVDRAANQESESTDTTRSDDIHIDWSTIGKSSTRMNYIGAAMADLLADYDATTVVGIEKAGVPLATVVAQECDHDLAAYAPRKHRLESDTGSTTEKVRGTFSRNFATIEGERCVIVDDAITSGTTITEAVQSVREHGGNPVACAVLADKRGLGSVEDVPVHSMLQIISVGAQS